MPKNKRLYIPTTKLIQKQQWLALWLKLQWLLFPFLFYLLYQQIFPNLDWALWREQLGHNWANGTWIYLLLVIALVPFNWWLETQKWRSLLGDELRLRPAKAFRAVLRGVTLSLFTPNRMGEYGGRILYAAPKERWALFRATLWGSLAQWIVLLGLGLPAMALVVQQLLDINPSIWLSLGLLLWLVLVLLYFFIHHLISRVPLPKSWSSYLQHHSKAINAIHPKQKTKALLLAFARYLIYSGQFFLLLSFFGCNFPLYFGLIGIATIFLAQAGLPLPPGLSLLARSELALLIWPLANPAAVVAASLALFILNLAVPALLGLVFIVKTIDGKSKYHEA